MVKYNQTVLFYNILYIFYRHYFAVVILSGFQNYFQTVFSLKLKKCILITIILDEASATSLGKIKSPQVYSVYVQL